MDQNNNTWDGESYIRSKKKRTNKFIALIVALTLVICSISIGALLIADRAGDASGSDNSSESVQGSDESNNNPSYISTNPKSSEAFEDAAEVYAKCAPSCATISVTLRNGRAIGSGFVVSEDGYIVTNNHVIENYTKIQVIFYNGEQYDAELVGADALSDIAVLKINATGLTPLDIGDSDTVNVGDVVYAIGTPYSSALAGTLTSGLISGVNRKIDVTNDYGSVVKTMTLIQTDSSINPGNSGGPLINIYGQVIGINTLKLMDEYEGIGFAIPITNAVTIINELIENGVVTNRPDDDIAKSTARLNITGTDVNETSIYNYSLPDDSPSGLLIIEISRSSAIFKAGVVQYDIITNFDGTDVTGISHVQTLLTEYNAGDEVTITVFRPNRSGSGGQYHNFTFKLEAAS